MSGTVRVDVDWDYYDELLQIRFIAGEEGGFVTTIRRNSFGIEFYSTFLNCVMYHNFRNIIGIQYVNEIFEDLSSMTEDEEIDDYIDGVTKVIEGNLYHTKINVSMFGTPTICLKLAGGKK